MFKDFLFEPPLKSVVIAKNNALPKGGRGVWKGSWSVNGTLAQVQFQQNITLNSLESHSFLNVISWRGEVFLKFFLFMCEINRPPFKCYTPVMQCCTFYRHGVIAILVD